jgi:hypothetical protein
MFSFVNQYNEFVEKKCKEQSVKNKVKSYRDYLAENRVYSKELGGTIAQPILTERQFKNFIKNAYTYLNQKIPTEPELEDLYAKSFNTFTFEEFNEFMDTLQFGEFNNIQDAYKSFTQELRNRELIATEPLEVSTDGSIASSIPSSAFSAPTPSPIEIDEDLSVTIGDVFTNIYPPVGQETEYGFSVMGRDNEMSETMRFTKMGKKKEMSEYMRSQQETLRRQEELKEGGRPVPEQATLTGQRGRPLQFDLPDLGDINQRFSREGSSLA